MKITSRRGIFIFFVISVNIFTGLQAQIKIGNAPELIHYSSLLELESIDKVLVITRVTSDQMIELRPLPGAIVYNIDTECLYFYKESAWINLCSTLNLEIDNQAIVNLNPSIAITHLGDTVNLEIARNAISSEHITDFGIANQDLQNNSITSDKLAPNSVGTNQLQDNTITDTEINYDLVTLSDFKNDVGYITANQISSANPGNALQIGTDSGLYLNENILQHFDGQWSSLSGIPTNLDTDSTDDFNGQWSSLSGIPTNLDTDTTDDFNGQWSSLSGIPTNLDTDSTDDFNGQWSSLTGIPANLDTDSTDDFNGQWSSLSGIPTNLDTDSTDDFNGQWSSLTGIPAGFADGTDENTIYLAGNGLSLSGTTFSVNNAQLTPSWNALTDLPGDFADGIDNVLDETTVDAFIANNGYLTTETDADPSNEIQNLSQVLLIGNDAGANLLVNLADPISPQDAATKSYVDAQLVTGAAGSIFFASTSGLPTENNAQLFWDNTNNRMGIGLASQPLQNKLTIAGSTRTSGLLNSAGTATTPAYRFTDNGNTGMFLANPSGILAFTTNGVEAARIDNSQNFGIGITAPLERFHVGGNIRSDGNFISFNPSIQVPDYVFQHYFTGSSNLNTMYQFMKLEEVREFIQKNHHLPDIPSAAEIQNQGGIILNESTLQNLQKIEELFLYTLEQEDKINTLVNQNQQLFQELKELKKRLDQLAQLATENQTD
ncbi:MAG: hypothetical protein RLZZ241_1635 [Bacteroidota bacterium]